MNTEHTWPQSRGARPDVPKADLHHLFPCMSDINNRRGNMEFGVVPNPTYTEKGSKIGLGVDGQQRFEPRDVSKGKVARVILYFSVIYDTPIGDVEEQALRDWHAAYPVDDHDRARHEDIVQAQGSRNPFIDNPELVDRIADF